MGGQVVRCLLDQFSGGAITPIGTLADQLAQRRNILPFSGLSPTNQPVQIEGPGGFQDGLAQCRRRPSTVGRTTDGAECRPAESVTTPFITQLPTQPAGSVNRARAVTGVSYRAGSRNEH